MELNQTEILIFAIVWAAGFGIIIWYLKKSRRNVIEERTNVTEIKHVYKVRADKDKRGADLISNVLPFARRMT